jgi:hypothetical protein
MDSEDKQIVEAFLSEDPDEIIDGAVALAQKLPWPEKHAILLCLEEMDVEALDEHLRRYVEAVWNGRTGVTDRSWMVGAFMRYRRRGWR